MKRSKMITEIKQFINTRLYAPYHFDDEEIGKLLSHIEKLGMAPPTRKTITDRENPLWSYLTQAWENE